MKTTIKNSQTGEILTLQRSVTATHPLWVHQQMGTSGSESELQAALDQYQPGERDMDGVQVAL